LERYHGPWRAISALAAAAVLWFLIRPFRVAVEGRSMAPALQPGDFLIASATKRPVRGSLVVLDHPGRPGFELVKRVERVPGEERLGPDQFWVAGDAPLASSDSRSFGPVPKSAIAGVVVARYWPPARAAWLLGRR